MAVQNIPDPDGSNMFGWPNGWLRYIFQKKIIDRINRGWKVSVDPNAATSKIEETETDFTLTIGKDVASAGTGIPDPPDKTKAWMLVWIPAHTNGDVTTPAKAVWLKGPPQTGIRYALTCIDTGDYDGTFEGTPPFEWVQVGTCGGS